jgi:hypothetical protein
MEWRGEIEQACWVVGERQGGMMEADETAAERGVDGSRYGKER